ncbi:rod-determining factor RdfA [Salarchaeum japonicum]|uniref:rod-determining factor RdfA n=1 Tax=Salarchaeum japonicum TaxID=555573 RepID=UPI003C78257C
MTDADDSADAESRPSGKVARLIDEHDLVGLGDDLEDRWTAEGDRRMSLRDLADYVNRELLAAVLADADAQPLDGEVENTYRVLTDDDVRGATRTRARRQLEREGVDVDEVESSFVTYQAVRSYLKDERGAEYSSTGPSAANHRQTIQQLQGRLRSVTESKLNALAGDDVTLGEFRTLVSVRVVCEDCGGQYEVGELLDRGGCNCE